MNFEDSSWLPCSFLDKTVEGDSHLFSKIYTNSKKFCRKIFILTYFLKKWVKKSMFFLIFWQLCRWIFSKMNTAKIQAQRHIRAKFRVDQTLRSKVMVRTDVTVFGLLIVINRIEFFTISFLCEIIYCD